MTSEAERKEIPSCLGDNFIEKVPELNAKRNGRFNEFYEIMRKRTYCNDKCKYYKMCPLRPHSQSQENRTKDGKYPCLLKKMEPDAQRVYLNLFLNGRYGMANELLNALFQYRGSIDMTKKSQAKEYLEMVMKANKELYGSAKNVEAPPDMEVKITEVAKATPINKIEDGKTQIQKGLKKEYALDVPEEEDDPDSLLIDGSYVRAYISGDKLPEE